MKIYKVTARYAIAKPTYLVVDSLNDVEPLFRKVYKDSDIIEVVLVSDNVINQWAQ